MPNYYPYYRCVTAFHRNLRQAHGMSAHLQLFKCVKCAKLFVTFGVPCASGLLGAPQLLLVFQPQAISDIADEVLSVCDDSL